MTSKKDGRLKDYSEIASANAAVTTSSLLNLISRLLVGFNVAVRAYCALYMIISDCDETFNYWEPLNLLLRGFGKQTWEYSPEYAIRAYTYLIPYYLVGYPIQLLSSALGELPHSYSYYQFYIIRAVALCGVTSYGEIRLTRSIEKYLNLKIACWFLFFSTVSPGMSHAGVALLPSTFAMQCSTFAFAYVLESIVSASVESTILAITWFLAGGIFGWPFALALGVTFGLYTILNLKNWQGNKMVLIIGGCVLSLSAILATITLIDSYFYSKILLVPLNIVFYNVFGGEGEGPEIFGVEPFSYYILNLLVNFNIIAVLGYLGLVLNPLLSRKSFGIAFNLSLPLLLWSVIFFSQPHKEERFLYPAYPLIVVNAAILVYHIFAVFGQVSTKILSNFKYRSLFTRFVQTIFSLLVLVVSILRIVNLVENYSAPLQTFELVSKLPSSSTPVNVCIAKEWYHFPNSFFLPDNYRLRFVQSGFDGLLPGDFEESFQSLQKITSHIPLNMNNKNQFETDKVIEFGQCDYFIDNTEKSSQHVKEPNIIQEDRNGTHVVDPEWELMGCNKIIDPNGAHSGIGRLIYIPVRLRQYISYDVKYLNFCAMRKTSIV
ncbi:glycosyltransferase family 22 protein [Suhomyces tanzawaensis NRRL Y-17324]|uniref:Mannosyltransferase n=1 Tax=Suhomyces tanzawaensis NRRL Y-17324 TaxID=984487 RepID=A0A1E4SB39_9ASCO|nr:glycosyltransferase family 22 protein [Suhomyces tanzawaensis NRRL Y-17324]ODV76686.1 glycosyltransferase family 22 protein [Suhomyces tanzawaensis NRRL Y-17324]